MNDILTTEELDSFLWKAIRKYFDVKLIRRVPFEDTPKVDVPTNVLNKWEVSSSRDASKKYTVTRKTGDRWYCECHGFVYRGKCRHIDAKKKLFSHV